ncbi:Molybdenum cofactor guanylyltransferase [Neolewinella maritima]|uniref:Probable molybdenum cofactor guanylyltransferase n=1 Tax=Neolewinella maritima TaxID=1383882 RepID=A0ABM9AY93_9BACT|nr:NTP transferase domain-containing protein [Neolewinella maritima]CAH0999465.1 Molybdenum cofactor guanylyltransferase [Neolewinella maritima]
MHHKHPPLARPALGQYARTELAFVGSTCARMEAVMRDWMQQLGDYRTLLVTGEHTAPEVATSIRSDRKHFTSSHASWNAFDDRLLGGQYDLALVNGNHYPAARQIVFVDEAKAGTLVRRKDQLSDVLAVVLVDTETVPDWLQQHVEAQESAPAVLPFSAVDTLLPKLLELLQAATPPLRALILAGGKSERMGADKSRLVYRDGQTEVERLRDLCRSLELPVHLSVRDATFAANVADLPLVADRFLGLGPAGAIASAFLSAPDAAWLVLACDLPLLDEATLRTLLTARRPDRLATAVRGPGKPWPEPLVAIYEPRAYQRLLQFLSLGYACPRKLLINSDVAVVDLPDGRPLTNANTPEERERVLGQIGVAPHGR